MYCTIVASWWVLAKQQQNQNHCAAKTHFILISIHKKIIILARVNCSPESHQRRKCQPLLGAWHDLSFIVPFVTVICFALLGGGLKVSNSHQTSWQLVPHLPIQHYRVQREQSTVRLFPFAIFTWGGLDGVGSCRVTRHRWILVGHRKPGRNRSEAAVNPERQQLSMRIRGPLEPGKLLRSRTFLRGTFVPLSPWKGFAVEAM